MPPSPNGSNGSGRTKAGRFAAGNGGGPGNPHARRTAALRSALLDALTTDDLRSLVASLVEKAKVGDVACAKLVLAYTVGPPLEIVDPDRLDEHEWSVARGRPSAIDKKLAELTDELTG